MRTVWVEPGDVIGTTEPGQIVEAVRPLSDWCLRGDDGSEPIPAGTALEIVEERPWGKAMAQELPGHVEHDEAPAIMQAMVELEADGLWEFAS